MTSYAKEAPFAWCRSEYDTLQSVLVCPPHYMEIKEVINDVQKRYQKENIDTEKATQQHKQFVKALQENGVAVELLQPSEQFPEQVFTRDIGFTVDDTVFIGEMASSIRQGEEAELEKWLKSQQIRFESLGCNRVEGGDVIIDHDTLYVGISSRTSKTAIQELQEKLPRFNVVPISFDEKYLHLDCVFNILSPTEALIFPEALDAETIKMLAKRYTLLKVNAEEQFALGTNVLSIGNRRVFSQPQNKKVNHLLKKHNFNVIEVDFSEIIKSGGAFRCCTMPLVRK
ncbi:dimethylarginine dimethylaminohydrolase family protein [Planococcus glaciei]|uniref:dimethylarginine dimethylaminohydrolase family protein n=1 Tax=Planococcus glaciei TaxID=459472 RepID=UPI0003DEF661|nr:arginine deiminase family protein [Planococcus glaciei]ETP70160.1 hypothetical protein G159_02995 [Planococcus glaciei CHR43]MBX0315730.1 hypothetical protein [Planococcus glaciei]SDG93476.1 N-Dimethylarginine dimethylaminohydrolase [Planococcus glaciei]